MASQFDEDFTKGLGDIQPFVNDYIKNMGVVGSEFDGAEILKSAAASTTPVTTNGTWEDYNAFGDDQFYQGRDMKTHLADIKSMSDSPIESIAPYVGETNTLHPDYQAPVTVDLASGEQFTYKDQTVTYKNGLVVQEATTYIGSDDDLAYKDDKDRVISRTDNFDGTVTYKFNNSEGAPGQRVEPLGKMQDNGVFIDEYESAEDQSKIAVGDVKSLEARIQALELNPEFAEPGQLEALRAKLQAANNSVIEAAAAVELEESNLVEQAITVEEITAVDEAAAVFAAAEIETIEKDTSTDPKEEEEEKKKIVTDITVNSPHLNDDVSTDLEEVTTIDTEEGKNAWVEKIRSFYSENPEVATALIRAASAYLQTGKWYVAAAKGLEGGIEGAAVKAAADKTLKSKRESLRNNGYTGQSINKYLVTGNVEDLQIDFTKKDREMTDWVTKENAKNSNTAAVKYLDYFKKLPKENQAYVHTNAEKLVNNTRDMYAVGGDGERFLKLNAGIEHGDMQAMILDYTQRMVKDPESGEMVYLLPRDKHGAVDFNNIPVEVIKDMQNVAENYSRIQYKQFLATGKIDSNLTFTNYKEQYYLRADLIDTDSDGVKLFDAAMFDHNTSDGEGEFAGEAMMVGNRQIDVQLNTNKKFDMDSETDGIQKPTVNQIWTQLAIQWESLSQDQRDMWNDNALEDKTLDTTGFLFFSDTLITDGEDKGWMKENNIKLFSPRKVEETK
tara:strand:- start:3846 stop:6029 length:2184 start_codon:yes stop_codon:yes gene_type:complete